MRQGIDKATGANEKRRQESEGREEPLKSTEDQKIPAQRTELSGFLGSSPMLSPDPNPKDNGEKETVFSGILEAIVPLFLLALNLLIYWQVTRHGFLNYLDDPNLVNNPHVRGGISTEGAAWCFRIVEGGGWRPLAWLSHMLDFHLYGLNPGSHHLTSLFFHTVNTMLLFLFLRRATGARWPSAFVAVVFAVHPLNVESVAWVSERKTVLSAFFLFTSLWSYILYTEKPGPSRYFICLFLCALGLMAGPIAISLPLLLLIMDYWPLGRLRFKPGAGLPVLREGHRATSFAFGKDTLSCSNCLLHCNDLFSPSAR